MKNQISNLVASQKSRNVQAEKDLVIARSRTEEAERKVQDVTTRLNGVRAAVEIGLDEVKKELSTVTYQHSRVLTHPLATPLCNLFSEISNLVMTFRKRPSSD